MAAHTTKKSPRVSWVRLAVGSLILLILGTIWTLFLSGRFKAFEVLGNSMVPTLERGDRIIAWEEDPEELHRGDIVVVDPPPGDDDNTELVKRLMALPGDVIELRFGAFFVNGEPQPLPEGATPHSGFTWIPRTRLGIDQYYVLGDNRPVSYDSEEFGPVGPAAIRGKVLLRYSPWSKRKIFH